MRYVPSLLTREDFRAFGIPPMPSSYKDGFGAYAERCAVCMTLYSSNLFHRIFKGHKPVKGWEYPHHCTEFCADPCDIKDVCYVIGEES